MHTEECLCQWLRPFSGTGQRLFISGNTSGPIPDVLQLVAGAATSLAQFIRSCHLFRLVTWLLEVGHLIQPASTRPQGY